MNIFHLNEKKLENHTFLIMENYLKLYILKMNFLLKILKNLLLKILNNSLIYFFRKKINNLFRFKKFRLIKN
jgi:hypothetical protein